MNDELFLGWWGGNGGAPPLHHSFVAEHKTRHNTMLTLQLCSHIWPQTDLPQNQQIFFVHFNILEKIQSTGHAYGGRTNLTKSGELNERREGILVGGTRKGSREL